MIRTRDDSAWVRLVWSPGDKMTKLRLDNQIREIAMGGSAKREGR